MDNSRAIMVVGLESYFTVILQLFAFLPKIIGECESNWKFFRNGFLLSEKISADA
jgi:hypothetical protein